MDKLGTLIMAIFGGIITLAIISVIISRQSQAPQVIQAGASALGNVVSAAVNPLPAGSTQGPSQSTIGVQTIPWNSLISPNFFGGN